MLEANAWLELGGFGGAAGVTAADASFSFYEKGDFTMSAIYDNWDRLVGATLLREHLRELARAPSLASTDFDESFRRKPRISESSLSYSDLGYQFTHSQILRATGNFKEKNLIKRGRSGDFFRDFSQASNPVVVKRIDLTLIGNQEAYLWELDFLSKVGKTRHFPYLGHCLKEKDEKFLVYKYMCNGDLSSSLFKKDPRDDGLISLDWITRLKIAVGAADGLAYLHHEFNPPLVHGDVQASSILLDDKFEVRLGSLSPSQENEKLDVEDDWIIRDPENDTLDTLEVTCPYDVYCFGKVLLELVTGRLGISSPNAITHESLEATLLHCISLTNKELIVNIVDPTLIIDEDLLEEVWCMGIVAKCCLDPQPERRPQMRDVLKALENPLELLMRRTEQAGSSVILSLENSWTNALLGDWSSTMKI